MKSKRIKYFSFRGCSDKGQIRSNSPAADSKLDYIIQTLNKIGYSVDMISMSYSATKKILPPYFKVEGDNTYRYFASFGKTNSIFRVASRWFMEIQFFIWCFFNIRRGEQIIVYHSLGYDSIFIKLKFLKKINIIGEIEELYQDVSRQKPSKEHNEFRFLDICDKYIFPSELFEQNVNTKNKPSSVIYGVYANENILENKFDDGKIHVVYGGTLDPNKGGAIAAINSAQYLTAKYHIHICGFGNYANTLNSIQSIQTKTEATITFEGELKGNDYKRFIQKCHIGLSTQNPEASFNDTSFPSKILVYLSNGLRVVSVRIPVIESSLISECVTYYNLQDAKELALAIMSVDLNNTKKYKEVLEVLDNDFSNNLKYLISKR